MLFTNPLGVLVHFFVLISQILCVLYPDTDLWVSSEDGFGQEELFTHRQKASSDCEFMGSELPKLMTDCDQSSKLQFCYLWLKHILSSNVHSRAPSGTRLKQRPHRKSEPCCPLSFPLLPHSSPIFLGSSAFIKHLHMSPHLRVFCLENLT